MKKKVLFGQRWAFEGYLPGEIKEGLQGFALRKTLFSKQSRYQRIDIVETVGFGRMLFLDGFVQLSTRFEAVYHEMLVHPALCSHARPDRVLVIGGGDGGALREILKHPVKEVTLVEIDQEVIKASQKYLRAVCRNAFQDPRVRIFIDDGMHFIKTCISMFDCIVSDLTDPDGSISRALFTKLFFLRAKRALRKHGILATQTGYVSDDFGQEVRRQMRAVFPDFQIHKAFVNHFPTWEHSFSFGSSHGVFSKLSENEIALRFHKRKLHARYYTPQIHFASKVFPPFLKSKL
ncbi:MAG: polyamine aminopropyltransferase [Candidatus Wildermuthbacteria bacterium]|nr:polyamine aminopropyltransferase [Candidatus Wildermuthbacteria bacterium]